ncbi:DUF305 domain-containing protein [Planctomonas psychrotolerans]|uniref:DUF305 domain-containing protein n=1 Tax=Planctomonas psychrotolerans TaxID=2528712 RepID=UPI00123B17E4|nr:DUF305 domain-containing protein [Planctomonas psychrotolerans]
MTEVRTEASPSTEASPEASATFDRRTRLTISAILAGTVILLLGFGAGWLARPQPASAALPTTTSAEAGFARDMQVHHQQAVEMSVLLRDRSENEEVRTLALDILTGQGQQAGQMYGWLAMWGLPQAPAEPRMTWMMRPPLAGAGNHEHGSSDGAMADHVPGEPMPGLASPEDIARLTAASGSAADRLYLELMIEHHRGGVTMADAVLDRSANRTVTDLASSMTAAQQAEIDYMTDLLGRV